MNTCKNCGRQISHRIDIDENGDDILIWEHTETGSQFCHDGGSSTAQPEEEEKSEPTSLSIQDRRELGAWISYLENTLGNAQSAVINYFCEDTPAHRRAMLNFLTDTSTLWSERPYETINRLNQPEPDND